MTRTDLKKHFRKAKKQLCEEDDDGNIIVKRDALIVTLSGHGNYDSLICSDGAHYRYKDIRQIFSNEDELARIPKLFLVDACRVDDDEEKSSGYGTRASSAKNLSGTIMATTEGNSVRGGKIAFTISKYFKENYDNKTFTAFRNVRFSAKHLIESNTDQALVLNEYDDDIDSITFKPNE